MTPRDHKLGLPSSVGSVLGTSKAELIGGMQYEDTYRLAYFREPEGIIVALAE